MVRKCKIEPRCRIHGSYYMLPMMLWCFQIKIWVWVPHIWISPIGCVGFKWGSSTVATASLRVHVVWGYSAATMTGQSSLISCRVPSKYPNLQWGSPHENVDPDLMRIRDPDPKTTLSPNGLRYGTELYAVLRDSASSSAICAVCVPCRAHARVTLNPHRGSGFSESGFSACVESPNSQSGTALWDLHSQSGEFRCVEDVNNVIMSEYGYRIWVCIKYDSVIVRIVSKVREINNNDLLGEQFSLLKSPPLRKWFKLSIGSK